MLYKYPFSKINMTDSTNCDSPCHSINRKQAAIKKMWFA